jgi:hypothetical protein
LKQALQKVVRLVLRVGQIGAPDREQRSRCEAPNRLGNDHGENSRFMAAATGPRLVTETLTPAWPPVLGPGCRRPTFIEQQRDLAKLYRGLCSKPMRRLYLNKHFGKKAISMPAKSSQTMSALTSNPQISNGPA